MVALYPSDANLRNARSRRSGLTSRFVLNAQQKIGKSAYLLLLQTNDMFNIGTTHVEPSRIATNELYEARRARRA